jgi:hypothetical protein
LQNRSIIDIKKKLQMAWNSKLNIIKIKIE